MKEYLIVYNFLRRDYSVFHNAYITAANKKDAIKKLKEKIDNPIIINIILLSEDSDITE
jgi:hypothetical protein